MDYIKDYKLRGLNIELLGAQFSYLWLLGAEIGNVIETRQNL